MNLRENSINKTINIINIVEQLNNITDVVNGSNSKSLSDVQVANINKSIKELKNNLDGLKVDVDKYIDEEELNNSLKDIKENLLNSVNNNEFTKQINILNTMILTINGKLTELSSKENIDLTEYVKNNELKSKVEKNIKSSIDKIETKFLENSKEIIKNNVNDKITELVGNIDTKINSEITKKLDLEVKNINENLNEKTKDIISQNDLTNKLKDYAKLKDNNEFINNNDFKKISTIELNSNIINSNIYKINNSEFINNDSMFSIGIIDKDINLISKGKLMLNGVEVGNNELPQSLVHTDKENTLNYKLNGTVADFNTFKIKDTEVVRKDNNNIILGADNNITTLKGTDLYFNNDKIEFNKFVKESDLSKYAKLDENNTFTGKITGKEIKSNSIETNSLKVNGKDVVTDTLNFAKLNSSNVFTQKIKGIDIESNKLITQELTLNGVNVNLSDYATNNNLIKQVEKIIGLVYDGNIQDSKNKIVGKFYYDDINKYFYECIVDNNLTYVDGTKFKPISNKPLKDKIEDLTQITTTKLEIFYRDSNNTNDICNIVWKIGNIVIIIFDSGNTLYNIDYSTNIFRIPENFRPKKFLSVQTGVYNNVSSSIFISEDGIGSWRGGFNRDSGISFTVTYII